MVNGISNNTLYPTMNTTARTFVQASSRYSNDVENMVKYLNGQPMNPQDEMPVSEVVSSNIPFVALFGGISGLSELKKHHFSLKNTVAAVNTASPIKSRNQVWQAATAGISDKFKDVFKKSVAVDNSKRWKIFKPLDKIPGYAAARQSGFGQMLKKTGAGWWGVFSGVAELFTQVVPAFQQGGATSGLKQLGKSGVKVAADVGGFIAGDVICRGAGAAIGTMICPGIGTAIGSFIGGFLGGILGSAVAGKAVKAIVGPSEIEKIQKEQIAQVTEQIEADPASKVQLALQTLEQANAVLAQDPENQDALAAKASAEKVIAEYEQQSHFPQTTSVTGEPANAQAVPQPYQAFTQSGVPVVPGFNGFGYDLNTYRQYLQNSSAKAANIGTLNNPFNPTQRLHNPLTAQKTQA